MKKSRKEIHQLFDKRCAYCGSILKDESGKHMHVDHVKPLRRNWWNSDCLRPENDNDENLFPSCPKCNNYKHSMSVEEFREEIGKSLERCENHTSFRNAMRFGMIRVIKWDRLFWFERNDYSNSEINLK